ncbi:FAD/NAD(P)-binding domain-containing protein [Aureobasidium sp. EXF-3400]|nr:FAD/NAD(P)-binding domain-containing protein [Aureobasidium sp. EXF-12344]KAI4768886.1 FAD/NAD(P)-binding domain-containing protein [Aureobasidium sp. EXF-3400]
MLASRSAILPRTLAVTRQYKSTAPTAVLRGHGQETISRLNNAGQLISRTQTRLLTRSIESSKGGWAGYTLARDLDPKKYQVVVVSPRSYFVFTPLLASTSTGTLEFRTALEPVRSHRTKVEFFQGWADSVDFVTKTLKVEEAVENPWQAMALTADGREDQNANNLGQEKGAEPKKGKMFEMNYDKLVVAVGCYSQTFGTPGVKENAYFLKDIGDARKIRNRMLSCFETASLPTTSEQMKRQLLSFAVVGGGPTGIEFSAELHDLISEDMSKIYPDLMQYYKISVYDVAEKVLSMFDDKLAKYAIERFTREGIDVKTSHHVKSLRRGSPKKLQDGGDQVVKDDTSCYTLDLEEEGEVGVGMVVWSTGLMMNPFISKSLAKPYTIPISSAAVETPSDAKSWNISTHPRSGGIMTNDRLRVIMQPSNQAKDGEKVNGRAIINDVYALGDCAIMENSAYPATAQVANQKARWLAKQLNRNTIDSNAFTYKDLGIMAYVGNWNAIVSSSGADVSGRVAWLIWRGAYLAKSVSWRNRILIPTYWFVNWVFGRDISRF